MTALSCSSPFLRPIEIVGGSQGRQIERSHGRQGKRPAFGSAYVVGWIGQFDDIGDMPCWRFLRFVQANQRTERRHTTARPGLWP
jgi:hypothetical protein